MEDIDVAIVTAPITGAITGVLEIQCLKWDCRRQRQEDLNFCSNLCAVRCSVERDYQQPLLLASLYKKFADYERFILSKVLAALKRHPVVQPGIPDLSADADILSDFPWNKPAVFDVHMENNESNKLWLFIGNFNLSAIWKVGNVVPGGMFRAVIKPKTRSANTHGFKMYRYSIMGSTTIGLFCFFFSKKEVVLEGDEDLEQPDEGNEIPPPDVNLPTGPGGGQGGQEDDFEDNFEDLVGMNEPTFIRMDLSTVSAINRSSPLSIGQTLTSPTGFFELCFFSPNNSRNQYVGIWFKNITPQVVVWVANRDKPVTNSAANLTISRNGSLILLDEKEDVIWSAGENFTSNKCHAELLDTGNLVVIDDVSRETLWQSFENLGNTLLPQSSLMYDTVHGKKRVLTTWTSNNDPSPGEFSLEITPQVPLQGLIRKGSRPYWRTGPWATTRFCGFPQFDESYVSPFSVVQDVARGTGTFSYSMLRNYILSYITLTPEGQMKIYWDDGVRWMHHLTLPESLCDLYGACGPFGLCVRYVTPKCICLKGFIPKSDDEWRKGNWTGGCVRRTKLSCQANSSLTTQGKDTDVFYRMTNAKTPDLHQVASFLSAKQCYEGCLGNCSCTAFAYISGIGCLVWNGRLVDTVQFMSNGETLSIRLASSELASGSSRTKIIVGITASLSILAILVSAAVMFLRYRAKHIEPTPTVIDTLQDAWKNDFQPQDISGVNFFDMHTLRTATNNFSASNKLGQGGFGPVYKGKLLDGKEIAVKRLASSSDQGTMEFLNEITLISKLQHRNLVRLLGYCIEGEEKLLIYEFMVNKSLDIFLFDSTLKFELDWPKRFDIIQGIARGLLYLHRDSRLRVIHRDLKVSNILLDEKMIPKISDFGLARMFQGTQYQDNTHRVVGTLGYMSPEYAWAGLFSEKSDIYSLGVLMLEIISGKKISRFSFGDGSKGLLAFAWESWRDTGGSDLLDRDLADSCNAFEVARCVQIGLLCVQHEYVDRPNTLQLLSMITSTTDLPTPKQPVFAAQTLNDASMSRSKSKDYISVNELTQSVVQGR